MLVLKIATLYYMTSCKITVLY